MVGLGDLHRYQRKGDRERGPEDTSPHRLPMKRLPFRRQRPQSLQHLALFEKSPGVQTLEFQRSALQIL